MPGRFVPASQIKTEYMISQTLCPAELNDQVSFREFSPLGLSVEIYSISHCCDNKYLGR
jgi:hypothetical protein